MVITFIIPAKMPFVNRIGGLDFVRALLYNENNRKVKEGTPTGRAKRRRMSEHLHENHRERMRQRYRIEGPDGFSSHELLEMLLYYSVPRGDTNGTAHALLEQNGGLWGVLNAQPEVLELTDGVGEKTAMMLRLMGDLIRRSAIEQRPQPPRLDTYNKVRAYMEPYYLGLDRERVYALMFDNRMRLIDFYHVCDGTINEAHPIARDISRRALIKNASAVIVTHNHPDGFAIATAPDRDFTAKLEQALAINSTILLEHMLFGDGSCIPLLQKHACMVRCSPTAQDADAFYAHFYGDMDTGKRSVAELLGMEEKGI